MNWMNKAEGLLLPSSFLLVLQWSSNCGEYATYYSCSRKCCPLDTGFSGWQGEQSYDACSIQAPQQSCSWVSDLLLQSFKRMPCNSSGWYRSTDSYYYLPPCTALLRSQAVQSNYLSSYPWSIPCFLGVFFIRFTSQHNYCFVQKALKSPFSISKEACSGSGKCVLFAYDYSTTESRVGFLGQVLAVFLWFFLSAPSTG